MNNEQTSRTAARWATLIAIPLAALTGFTAFQLLKPASIGDPPADAMPTASVSAQPTTPVDVPVAQLDERGAVVCRALLSQLPDRLRGAQRRPVAAGPEQNAAYGDPPLTIACGGPAPSVAPADTLYELNGVCWYPDPDGLIWQTVDREVTITVAVPGQTEAPGQWLVGLGGIIASAVPSAAEIPSGCRSS